MFLADRNILANQAFNDFGSFENGNPGALVRINPADIRKDGGVPKNGSVFFTIFQTLVCGPNTEVVEDEEGQTTKDSNPYYEQYPSDFFDLIIIDECHRGGANDESAEAFGSRVRRAVIWRSGSQIIAQIITWSVTLAVVRILEPGDYGLFAMGQVVITFLSFLNGDGLASALTQSETIDRQLIRQTFGMLILVNCVLAGTQYALAPVAAEYYHQPMVEDLLRVQVLLFLSVPFVAMPEVLLMRELDFKKPAMVNVVAALVSAAVALSCALAGMGVWSLVWAPIALFWTRAIGLTLAARCLD